MEKLYYTAKEVAEMLDVSVSHAYKVIREANRELSSKNKPSEYRHMARMGQLRKQAEAVNEEAYERLDNIEAAWLKKHMTGKKKTFMEQLYLRNQARAMAEEIVINEIVFKCR